MFYVLLYVAIPREYTITKLIGLNIISYQYITVHIIKFYFKPIIF